MNILLVAIHPAPSPQAVALANAFLKAQLLAHQELAGKISIRLLDFYLKDDPEGCAAAILAERPAALGFSVYVWNRLQTLAIAGHLRRLAPQLVLFAGGPEPTADPLGILASDLVDFVVVGEGEVSLPRAMARLESGLPLDGIPGILLPGLNEVTSPLPLVPSLDQLPSPYLTGCLDPSANSGALWQLSRGCDFACDFCYDHKGEGGVRRFSMKRLEEELHCFVRAGVSQVFVLDSTFNRDMKQAKALLELIRRRAPHIHFHFEVRSEFIDREMAGLFAEITCSLQIGLQSADPQVLKSVRRVFNKGDFLDRVALLNASGAVFGFDLIYGLPGDTLTGFRASLDFALGLYPNHLDIFPLALLPGTRLSSSAAALGLRHLPTPPYTLIDSPTFPEGDMIAARRLATACDIFYSRGKAVAWFSAVIKPLRLSPSAFLDAFAGYLEANGSLPDSEEDCPDARIREWQLGFVSGLYKSGRMVNLLPLALDLMDFHYHYAEALLSAAPELPTDRDLERTDLLAAPLAVASSAKLVRFTFEIVDILEAGEIDLKEFVRCFRPIGSQAVIYPRGGEVFTESLIEPYFLLLEALDGETGAGAIAARMAIPADEASSFLEFAAAEGIVQIVGVMSD